MDKVAGFSLRDRNGTTCVIFEPLDFMARLTALVANSRDYLSRIHGVFALFLYFIRHRLLRFGGYGSIAVSEGPLSGWTCRSLILREGQKVADSTHSWCKLLYYLLNGEDPVRKYSNELLMER